FWLRGVAQLGDTFRQPSPKGLNSVGPEREGACRPCPSCSQRGSFERLDLERARSSSERAQRGSGPLSLLSKREARRRRPDARQESSFADCANPAGQRRPALARDTPGADSLPGFSQRQAQQVEQAE